MIISNACRLMLCISVFWLPYVQATSSDITFYTEHLPPYSYVQDDRVIGINVELVEKLCQQLELSCSISLLPWRRAFSLAQHNPNSGVFSATLTEERAPLFQWVGPIASAEGYIFRLKGRTEVNPSNLEEAKQFSIAIARGDMLEGYFKSHGFEYGDNMLDISSRIEAAPLFLAKRIDLLVGSKRVIENWMLEHQELADMAEPLFILPDIGLHYLALNLQFPADIAQQLQLTLDTMRQNGELAALVERYQMHD